MSKEDTSAFVSMAVEHIMDGDIISKSDEYHRIYKVERNVQCDYTDIEYRGEMFTIYFENVEGEKGEVDLPRGSTIRKMKWHILPTWEAYKNYILTNMSVKIPR